MGEEKIMYIVSSRRIIEFRDYIIKLLTKHTMDEIIVVFNTSMLPKELVWKKIDSKYHRIIFGNDEIDYDIRNNSMVPPHTIVNSEDHPDKDKYPSIPTYDPMIRRIGATLNDVIEIKRPKGNYYRVVREVI